MSDLISRQAAIEAIEQMQMPIMRSEFPEEQFVFTGMSEALRAIKDLPSAQPKRTEERTETHACDLISRLSEIRSQYNCFNESEEPYYHALSEVIKKLSEQADGDTISRQAAIDALDVGAELLRRVLDEVDVVGAERAKYEWGLGLIESCISDIKELPSAQPEIIRCKDCKYYTPVTARCEVRGKGLYLIRGNEDYCSRAERRTDE